MLISSLQNQAVKNIVKLSKSRERREQQLRHNGVVFLFERFKADAPLNEPQPQTFYSHGPEGYIDYPAM